MVEPVNFHELRRTGIGASDVAAILGHNPYRSAISVYLDKIGEGQHEMTPALEWGQRLEPVIARKVIDMHGWELQSPGTMRHRKYPFLIATPDRINQAGELIEIKTSRLGQGWGETGTNEIPMPYWLQVQHQMEVASVDVCWVFALIGTSDFREYRIARDAEYLPMTIEMFKLFWECVQKRVPPEADFQSPHTLAELNRLYKPSPGKSIALSALAWELAQRYQDLGDLLKDLGAERDAIKARLIQEMGDAETGILPEGYAVTRKSCSRKPYTVAGGSYVDFRLKSPRKGALKDE